MEVWHDVELKQNKKLTAPRVDTTELHTTTIDPDGGTLISYGEISLNNNNIFMVNKLTCKEIEVEDGLDLTG